MVLKSCRECNRKVSTEASTCPSCGAPNPASSKTPPLQTQSSGLFGEIKKGMKAFEAGMKYEGLKTKKEPTKKDDGNMFGFWTGREGLAKTFWLYFIVANMIGNVLVVLAASEGSGMITFVNIIRIGWNIFAIIGVFNAADIYKNEMIKSGQTYGYATGAKIAVVILILSAIGNSIR